MHPRLALTFVLAVTLLLVAATGAVSAHDNVPVEPGASASCDNAAGDGGSTAVHVGDERQNFADPDEARSATAAVVYFAGNGGECENEGWYAEAHVNSNSGTVQYCYSEESDGDSADDGHSDEPTDSTTAGLGAGELNLGDGSGGEDAPRGDGFCDYAAHNGTAD